MKQLTCEMCGSIELIKRDGVFICQHCKCQYSVEEARKMMIEGTVDIEGTVKIDNSAFIEKYLSNARRAYDKEDWEEVEKYYNMVEQNSHYNIEAVFFSAFGKTMLSFTDDDYYKRQHKFTVLNKSISVINDYYELSNENKEEVLKNISNAIKKMYSVEYVYNVMEGSDIGGDAWQINLMNSVKDTFITELKQIAEKHSDAYIQELIDNLSSLEVKNGGCYIATCVYGSYNCPEVWTLRRYRDHVLAETWYGRTFIKIYYTISPTLVNRFGNTKWFQQFWKGTLDQMVKTLQSKGIESSPYQDTTW